jgi:hypothetical protein
VQDFAIHESYPTHPLGKRESWPTTGPIYGLPELDAKPATSGTIWQRWVTGVTEIPENIVMPPGSSPIWY